MAIRRFVNTATQAATTAAIAATDTSITVSNYAGYPSSFPFTAALARGTANEEIVLVTAASGSTLTVTRGYDGTTAKAQTAGTTLLHVVAALDFTEANAHVNAASAVHGVTGAVVGTTDAQTVTGKTFSGNTHVATSSADAVVANVPSGVTKNTFLGQNNGTTTFSVSQTGAVTAAGQVNAQAGLAVTGSGTVSVAFTVTGALTAGSLSTGGNLSVTGTGTVGGLLTASAGVRVVANGIRHVPITAPAGTAGEVTEWVQSDGGFYFRNGTGAPARSATHWGTVAAPANYPTSALAGDTVTVTSLSSIMRYNGSAWRQTEPAEVANAAARNAISSGLHNGFRIIEADTSRMYQWTGSVWAWIAGATNPAWISVSPASGFTNVGNGYEGLTINRALSGQVSLSGLIYNSTSYTNAPLMFIIPTGYRPAGAITGLCRIGQNQSSGSGAFTARMEVNTDGSTYVVAPFEIGANTHHGINMTWTSA